VIRPPATAHLDNRWNTAMDLAAASGVPAAELAEAWERYGPDGVLVMLRALAAVRDETAPGAV
jgi:hypothetical protein